eukprot:gnl/MRDRNA2_/MRDRNA2_79071_c0_seq2.p1 gnl/MRDRNA2_/MRDRNA2_79071_c0~~gnl/MRDRNA2_/MRDRNA2_79071_c0_seq2.p1  ORF type:complete len:311 (+),score=70.67 gnl/MRDRNA2_/MRDRNA2_79071_c0_seq2:120-935(+)
MPPWLQEDINEFIEDNDLGNRAVDKLWKADPEVQCSVIDEGSLKNEFNPSAALLRRISKAEADVARRSRWDLQLLKDRSIAKAQLREEVEDFLKQHDISETIADELLLAAPEVQRLVLDHGEIHRARNPTGVLKGRLNTAKADIAHMNLGDSSGSAQVRIGNKTIERFITKNDFNDKASKALHSACPEIQYKIVMQSNLYHDCENPSSSLMKRIKQCEELLARNDEKEHEPQTPTHERKASMPPCSYESNDHQESQTPPKQPKRISATSYL